MPQSPREEISTTQPHHTPRSPRAQRSPHGPAPCHSTFPPAPEDTGSPVRQCPRGGGGFLAVQPLPRPTSRSLRRKPDWQQSVAKSRVMTNRAVRATTGVVSVPDSHKGCWVPMRLAPDRYAYSDNGISLGMARSAGHPTHTSARKSTPPRGGLFPFVIMQFIKIPKYVLIQVQVNPPLGGVDCFAL